MRTTHRSILLFTLVTAALSFSSAPSQAAAASRDDIRVESSIIDGREVEIVHFSKSESTIIPAETDTELLRAQGLTVNEINGVRETSREIVEQTLQTAFADDIQDFTATNDAGETVKLKRNLLKVLIQQSASSPRLLKQFAAALWKFIVIETIQAGRQYVKDYKRAPKFTQFGIAFDFKIEPQVFISKFRPTAKLKWAAKNYSFYLDVSFKFKLNKNNHRRPSGMALHTRFRREEGTGGMALPALKAEFKLFESDDQAKAFRGKSWYPPFLLPAGSLVLDSSPHYFAVGVSAGLNIADYVAPGSFLTNTFVDFAQSQNEIDLRDVPGKASDAIKRAGRAMRPQTCSNLFR